LNPIPRTKSSAVNAHVSENHTCSEEIQCDWFDGSSVAESISLDDESSNEQELTLQTTKKIRKRKKKKMRKKRKKKPEKAWSIEADDSHGENRKSAYSKLSREECIQKERVHARRKQKCEKRMKILKEAEMDECTFAPKILTYEFSNGRSNFLTENQNYMNKYKSHHALAKLKVEDQQKDWFKPKINQNYDHVHDPDECGFERLYGHHEKLREKKIKFIKSRQNEINERYEKGSAKYFSKERSEMLYAEAKSLQNTRNLVLEKDNQRIQEMASSPKMSSKSMEHAKERKRCHFEQVLKDHLSEPRVNENTKIEYNDLKKLFASIGFYQEQKVLNWEESDEKEKNLYTKLINHLDPEKYGYVTLAAVRGFLDNLVDQNSGTKIPTEFRPLIVSQLHSPPPVRPLDVKAKWKRAKAKLKESVKHRLRLNKIIETIEKLNKQSKMTEIHTSRLRNRMMEEEMTNCTFSPKISKQSQNMGFVKPVVDRLFADFETRRMVRDASQKTIPEEAPQPVLPCKLNRKIFDPIKLPPNFGKAVQRLQRNRVLKRREEYEEKLKADAQDEKYKQRLRDKKNKYKKGPLLILELELNQGKVETIEIFEGDEIERVVFSFCKKHDLPDSAMRKLKNRLNIEVEKKLEKILTEEQVSTGSKEHQSEQYSVPTSSYDI